MANDPLEPRSQQSDPRRRPADTRDQEVTPPRGPFPFPIHPNVSPTRLVGNCKAAIELPP